MYSTQKEYKKTKIEEIQEVIRESQSAVRDNIDLVIQRGDKLDELREKSSNLQDNAIQFRKKSGKLQRQMYYKKLKVYLIFLLLILFILWFLLSMACGFDFHKCRA
jgi:vesicle-associated membrane protein 7